MGVPIPVHDVSPGSVSLIQHTAADVEDKWAENRGHGHERAIASGI